MPSLPLDSMAGFEHETSLAAGDAICLRLQKIPSYYIQVTMKSWVVQHKSIKWSLVVLGALPRHSQASNLGRQSSGGDRQRLHDLMATECVQAGHRYLW